MGRFVSKYAFTGSGVSQARQSCRMNYSSSSFQAVLVKIYSSKLPSSKLQAVAGRNNHKPQINYAGSVDLQRVQPVKSDNPTFH